MSRYFIHTGLVAATALFALAAVHSVGQHVSPGVWGSGALAGEARTKTRHRARHARRAPPSGSSPEEIARYFQLYGGYIDPTINKQSQAGPFDSGFFFDSGLGPNGGDSPYMN